MIPFVTTFIIGFLTFAAAPVLPIWSGYHANGWQTCEDGHHVGETFPSPDGCNTCSCTQNGIICTRRACAAPSSSSSSSAFFPPPASSASSIGSTPGKCFSTAQCGWNEICTTELGACESACEPWAEACIQVCAGRCIPREQAASSSSLHVDPDPCQPYVCRDGSVHPSCTSDGHVINYFVNPCFRDYETSSSSSSAEYVACTNERSIFDQTVAANQACQADADCVMYGQSCPYVTCGVAINQQALSDVQYAAGNVVGCIQNSGGPIACAGCLAQRATCQQGQCTAVQEPY